MSSIIFKYKNTRYLLCKTPQLIGYYIVTILYNINWLFERKKVEIQNNKEISGLTKFILPKQYI